MQEEYAQIIFDDITAYLSDVAEHINELSEMTGIHPLEFVNMIAMKTKEINRAKKEE